MLRASDQPIVIFTVWLGLACARSGEKEGSAVRPLCKSLLGGVVCSYINLCRPYG